MSHLASSRPPIPTISIRAEVVARDELRTNDSLHRIGLLLGSELDLERLVQRITDEATALCRAQFGALFYNFTNAAGESFVLYTLSGAPREAFAKFGMPRNTRVFAPTFNAERVVRSGDITKDPEYGHMAPHHGMPKGHLPVRSYLAVPVVLRSGEVLGGLFFGHSDPDVFTAHDEQMLVAVAAQAAVAIDNARLYRQRVAAEEALRASEARHRLVAEATNEGIWYWDIRAIRWSGMTACSRCSVCPARAGPVPSMRSSRSFIQRTVAGYSMHSRSIWLAEPPTSSTLSDCVMDQTSTGSARRKVAQIGTSTAGRCAWPEVLATSPHGIARRSASAGSIS